MILLFFYSSENICDINDRLNVDLRSISLWMEENKLTLNAKKTKAMLFCSQPKLDHSQHLKLYLNDVHLENVNDCKYLGVVLDQTMSWKPHVNQICLNVSKYIGLFYRIREWLATDQLNTIYKELVLPRLSYCDVVWGNCNGTLQTKIERLQKRAGRAILKVPVRTPSSILLDKLNWTLLSDRRRRNLHIAVYKCLAKLVPQGLQNYFTLVQNKHGHQTRGSSNGNISLSFKPNTEAGRRTFLFRGGKAWNDLPTETKTPLPICAAVFKSRF